MAWNDDEFSRSHDELLDRTVRRGEHLMRRRRRAWLGAAPLALLLIAIPAALGLAGEGGDGATLAASGPASTVRTTTTTTVRQPATATPILLAPTDSSTIAPRTVVTRTPPTTATTVVPTTTSSSTTSAPGATTTTIRSGRCRGDLVESIEGSSVICRTPTGELVCLMPLDFPAMVCPPTLPPLDAPQSGAGPGTPIQ